MKLKYGSFLKWVCGGSFLSAIGLVGYIGNWWNNYNAEVEATISTQQIQTNDKRTIAVCIADEREEIDWSEVQIVPSFYNPTTYDVEDIKVQYEVTATDIDFEPTDFFIKSKFSKTKVVYKYKEKELPSGDIVPSPFYSYSINGDYANCYVTTKENHKGGSAFEFQTQVHFFVVRNEKSFSFNEWVKICRIKMAEIITERSCDAYFIDKNHHIKHEHAFALNGSEEVPSQTKSEVKQEETIAHTHIQSLQTSDYDELSIIDHEIVSLNGRNILVAKFSQPTKIDFPYYIVCRNSDGEYNYIKVIGNGTRQSSNIIKRKENFRYLTLAKENDELKKYISFEKRDDGSTLMSLKKSLIVRYHVRNNEARDVLSWPEHNKLIIQKCNPEDIVIEKVFDYKKYWLDYLTLYFTIFAFVFVPLIVLYVLCSELKEAFAYWGTSLFREKFPLSIFLLFILVLFCGVFVIYKLSEEGYF